MRHLQKIRWLNHVSAIDIIHRMKLPFQKDGELRRSLYAILGFYPRDIRLYKQALMHKSAYGRKYRGEKQNNERLEFLGDAVLDAVVGDIVYHHFTGKSEGFLTNTRSKIVQRESLNKIAIEIGVDKLIQSSEAVHNAHNSNLCGNAFEALVGAVYEDRGYEACMQFMKRRILSTLVNIDKVAYKEVNFKSKLIEWCQKNRLRFDFQLISEGKEGTSSPTFVTDIVIEGVNCGTGKGYSKKESQQLSAKDALKKLKSEKGLEKSVFIAKSQRTAMDEQPEVLLPDVSADSVPVKECGECKPKRVKKGSTVAKRAEKKVEQQKKQIQQKESLLTDKEVSLPVSPTNIMPNDGLCVEATAEADVSMRNAKKLKSRRSTLSKKEEVQVVADPLSVLKANKKEIQVTAEETISLQQHECAMDEPVYANPLDNQKVVRKSRRRQNRSRTSTVSQDVHSPEKLMDS